MAHDNSYAGAAGTARPAGVHVQNRPALSLDSALRLFLKSRRRARKSASPESDHTGRNAFFPRSFWRSHLLPNSNLPSPPLSRKLKASDLIRALVLQRYLDRANPAALIKLGKLYRRHRNPERALTLFLLRRLLWRSTRRPPFTMDFINHLRFIQADEPSSDEDSSFMSGFVTSSSPGLRDQPSTSNSSTVTTPDQSDGETKAKTTKRKRGSETQSHSQVEDAVEASRAAKKSKPSQSAGPSNGLQKTETQKTSPEVNSKAPAAAPEQPQPNGIKEPKQKLDKEKSQAEKNEQCAARKPKSESGKPAPKPPTKAESSKDAPAAPPIKKKPVSQMEYFERRVHEILQDPLGFDDLVYDSNKKPPRHLARKFRQGRRHQRHPTPPLEMSGALGRVPDAKPAAPKRQSSESLAKNARKRAHQQKVKEQVQALKEQSVSSGKGGDGKNRVAEKKNGGHHQDQQSSSKKYTSMST